MSFWQGVDVPGPALTLVIIDRIPFPRPDDPLMAARREAAGRAGFQTVDLPRAATLLAQGAGRLISTATDRGVVAVLDPRLANSSYGPALVRALPPMRRTKGPGGEPRRSFAEIHAEATRPIGLSDSRRQDFGAPPAGRVDSAAMAPSDRDTPGSRLRAIANDPGRNPRRSRPAPALASSMVCGGCGDRRRLTASPTRSAAPRRRRRRPRSSPHPRCEQAGVRPRRVRAEPVLSLAPGFFTPITSPRLHKA